MNHPTSKGTIMNATPAATRLADFLAANNEAYELNDAAEAQALQNIIESARKAKASPAKLSDKRLRTIVEDAIADNEAEDDDDDLDAGDEANVVAITKNLKKALPTTKQAARGTHADCAHEATKVARAKCRRERAQKEFVARDTKA
jgi:hypothetical protein